MDHRGATSSGQDSDLGDALSTRSHNWRNRRLSAGVDRTLAALLFAAMVCWWTQAHAETCESLVARIIAAEGGEAISFKQIGFIAIRHPLTYSFSISCGKVLMASIGSEASPASAEFFDLVGRVTALFTPVTAEAAKAAAKRCINTAMVSTSTAEVVQDGVTFSCLPISEDGDVPKVEITPQQ